MIWNNFFEDMQKYNRADNVHDIHTVYDQVL